MFFRASAPSTSSSLHAHTPPPPRPLPPAGWSPSCSSPWPEAASNARRIRRLHPSCRSYSALFASADSGEPPPPADADKTEGNGAAEGQGDNMPGSSDDDSSSAAAGGVGDGGGGGGETKPQPRADEQVTEIFAGADAADAATGESLDGEAEVDWDKAWVSTKERMAKEKKEKRSAPAFSGRTQIVASKNDEGGYDFEEISADGSSRMQGGRGSGGFGFADSGREGEDGPASIRRKEQEAVNLATTNQAFLGLFAILLFSLIFEIYVYMSGGITNGATRFQDIGQPTTYDALPLPATPTLDDDLTV